MEDTERTERDYFRAKTQYVQDKRMLEKFVEGVQRKKLKQRQADKNKKKIEERIEKVKAGWEKVQEMRKSYLYANKVEDDEDEKWGLNNHSFVDEEESKETLIDDAEEHVDRLGGDQDDSPVVYEPTSTPTDTKEAQVMSDIKTTLSNVEVSRNDLAEFERQLSEQLVDDWKENSQCKIYTGVDKEKFPEFLDLLQEAAGFDSKVKAAFLASAMGDGFNDKVKSFTCETTKLDGTYGMYAVHTQKQERDGKPKLDVCYSVFTFNTKLLGLHKEEVLDKSVKGNESSERINEAKNGKKSKNIRKRLLKSQVDDVMPRPENVMTGESVNPNRHLRVKDITSLTQNFIVAKALQGFADAGVIPFVKYSEDRPSQLTVTDETQGAHGGIVQEPYSTT